MSRPTIEQLRNLPDYATVYMWNIFMVKSPVGAPIPAQFNTRVMTAALPTASNELITVAVRGHKVNQAGIQDYSNTIDVQFVETVDAAVMKFLDGWRETQWKTIEGTHKSREDSKADIMLQPLDRQNGVINTYVLMGCALPSYTLADLDGETSDAMKPTMTLQFDYFKNG